MKYLNTYRLFESVDTDLLKGDIRDIFTDVDDMPNFDVLVSKVTKHSCGTYGISIRIYRQPFKSYEENKPQTDLLKDTFDRLIDYLGDRLFNYEVKYSHDEDSVTLPYTSYGRGGDFKHKNIIPSGFRILGINLSLVL